jgi:hypothetical protein
VERDVPHPVGSKFIIQPLEIAEIALEKDGIVVCSLDTPLQNAYVRLLRGKGLLICFLEDF